MKKKILLAAVCAILLTGCGNQNQDSGNENASEINEKTNNESQSNENNNASQNGENENQNSDNNNNGNNENQNNDNNNENQNNNTNDGGNNENNQKFDEVETVTTTFKMTGATFEQYLPKRAQLRNEGNFQTNVDKTESYIKLFLEDDKMLSRLTIDGFVQTLDCGNSGNELYLCLGSSSTGGGITWNSTAKILKVEATVKNYYKSYSYGDVTGFNVDQNAHFLIDESDFSLELTDASAAPEAKTFNVSYDNGGVNSFRISSLEGRVLIQSLSITWAK